jgi:hypothetical protein
MQVISGRLGKFMPQISHNDRGINIKTFKKELASKTKKRSHRDTYAMCHARRLLDKTRPKLPGRATDTVPSDNRTCASDNNKNYHFVSTQSKNKEDACCLVLWPGHSNFKLSPKCKKYFGWLLKTRMPRRKARCANLAQTLSDVIVKNQCLISIFFGFPR